MFTPTLWRRHGLCLILLCFVALLPLHAQQKEQLFGNQTVPNRVVYKLKPQGAQLQLRSGAPGMAQALQQIGSPKVRQKFPETASLQRVATARFAAPKVDLSLIYELDYAPGYTFEQVKAALMATGQVSYVEPLYIREPLVQPNDPASDSTRTTQFYLKQVQAYAGWAVEQGDTNTVVGVLDTGFRLTHEDLKTKVKRNYADPIDGIDNDNDGLVDNYNGWDFADRDNNVTDNTPWKGHGTGVAGLVAAATNNGKGMAGLGYNTLFMPIKVFSSVPGGPFAGYEAIVYAANKGCKVINLSWGGTGSSQFEQDVIDYAVLVKDVLIVAAAGNTNQFVNVYPAAYKHVLSVGGASNQDLKYKDHTYNYEIDLIAPSANIYTTNINSDTRYAGSWGTSFASPAVAGGAALVRKRFPELNALQVTERMRATTDAIYQLEGNQPYLEMLGTGRFNLKKALKAEEPKSVRATFFAPRAGQKLAAGKEAILDASFINYLSPTQNLQVTLTSLSPYAKITRGSAALGALGTLAEATTGNSPFIITVSPDAPQNHKIYLRLGYTDANYSDFQHFELLVNPSFATLDANQLHLTLNSEGNIGYNGLNMKQGVGVTYKGGNSLLFEGGLMLGTGGLVADNLHNNSWQNDADFMPLHLASKTLNTTRATQEIRSLMRTNLEGFPEVEVKTTGFAWATEADQSYAIVEYELTNTSGSTIEQLHAALFADWDIGDYLKNAIGWDEDLRLGYAYSTAQELTYAGMALLTPATQLIYHASDNLNGDETTVGIDDGFSDEEKHFVVSGGKSRLAAGGEEGNSVSHALGATLTDLAPGQTKTVAIAILAGSNLQELQQHTRAAQAKYREIKTSPAPAVASYQTCLGSSVQIAPTGGTNFAFFADASGQQLLGSGQSYTLQGVQHNQQVYVACTDSVYSSALVPMPVEIPANASAKFRLYHSNNLNLKNELVTFEDISENASSWHWDFGDGNTSAKQNPQHIFENPGVYTVSLTVNNSLGCQPHTYTQQVQVFASEPVLYPNPASNRLHLALNSPLDLAQTDLPVLRLYDLSGKQVAELQYTSDNATNLSYDVSRLQPGMYIAHIMYKYDTLVQQIFISR